MPLFYPPSAGETGPAGPAGEDGASAYEVAVANGFVGTVEQWLASLVGEQGEPGPAGADGAPGADGADGADGVTPWVWVGPWAADQPYYPSDAVAYNGSTWVYNVEVPAGTAPSALNATLIASKGDTGATGATGEAGPAGADGAPGTPGVDGADGADGASAYQIAVANGFVGTEAEWLEYLKANPTDYAARTYYAVGAPIGPVPGDFTGTTHNVATYAELTSALTAAVDGDVINVTAAVVATATVNVTKRLKFTGAGSLETAGGTTDPVTLLNITADGVWLDGITIKHKKTSNTSVEAAVRVVANGFVSTANVQFMEFGYVLNGSFNISGTTSYTGALGNNHRHIAVYGVKQPSEVNGVTYDFPVEATPRASFIYLSSNNAVTETFDAPLVVRYTQQADPTRVQRQFFLQDAFATTTPQTASLLFIGNSFNDLNGGIGLYSVSGEPLSFFQYLGAVDNVQGNAGVASYKGLIYIDGTGTGRSIGSTTLFVKQNSSPTALRTDYTYALAKDIAFKNTVYGASTLEAVSYNDALDSALNFTMLMPMGGGGAGAEVWVESTTTLAPGSEAYVTNSSTDPSVALLNFGIPAGATGATGETGPAGPAGATGPAGPGVAAGGTAGQILAKVDGVDYNTTWIDNYTSEVKHLVKNGSGLTLLAGTPVYVVDGDGTNIIIDIASNASEATSSKVLGLLEDDILNNETGFVVTEGLLAGIDTSSSAEGSAVWLGLDGVLVYGDAPTPPAHAVYLGVVTRSQVVNGEIFVKVQNGYELSELHNVKFTDLADGNVLTYDSAQGLWVNEAPAGGAASSTLTVKNATGVTIPAGSAVYLTGDSTAGVPHASTTVIASGAWSEIVGINEADILDGATGTVVVSGSVTMDTSAWFLGSQLYIQTDSDQPNLYEITDYWPVSATTMVGRVTEVGTTGKVLLSIDTSWQWVPGHTLGEHTDAALAGATNGQVISFNSSTGKWEPASLSTPIVNKTVLTVKNVTGGELYQTQPVRITGVDAGVPTVATMNATSATAHDVIGLVTATIANNATGTIVTAGLLEGVYTEYLTAGAAVWLSTAGTGGLTSTKPTTGHPIRVGWCVTSAASGSILVDIDLGEDLSSLHDVTGTPSDNQVLTWDAVSGKWQPETPSTAVSAHASTHQSGGTDALTGLKSSQVPTMDILDLATTTYTLGASDAGRMIVRNGNATITVPANSTTPLPVGTRIDFVQTNATGVITFSPAAGVTINPSGTLKLATQYGVATLVKLATDTWLIMGMVSA